MKRTTKPKPTGLKTQFSPKDLRSISLLAKLGATNKQVAEFFKVSKDQISHWRMHYPIFVDAWARGALIADMKVANSLYSRAIGVHYVEEEYSAVELDGITVPMSQMMKVKRTKKWLPPDTKAATHWLSLRQREKWLKVTQTNYNIKGSFNHHHGLLQDIPVHELTPEAQRLLFEIAQKQLSNEIGETNPKQHEYEDAQMQEEEQEDD